MKPFQSLNKIREQGGYVKYPVRGPDVFKGGKSLHQQNLDSIEMTNKILRKTKIKKQDIAKKEENKSID